MSKYVFFAFKGEMLCFVHVLLNALDLSSNGADVKIVFEGEAVTLVKKLVEMENPLYKKAKERGLVDCICKACSAKMGVLKYNETAGIPMNSEMSGHPSMAAYLGKGYTIITM